MEQVLVSQNYDVYSPEDHETWKTLCRRQQERNSGAVSKEYLIGFNKLQLSKERVIRIEETSRRLEVISGWTLIPVTGLIPTRDFFYMLINKQYPVNVSIRKPHEIDFSEQPDIFHDVCGHLPLLTNDKFIKFLTAYSIIALKYVNNDRAIDFLGRLYWYTYEMGIIREDGEYRAYGGAIITSAEETSNILKEDVPKYPFEVGHIFRTPYNPYKLQSEYFIIDSFDDLFNCLEHLEEKLIEYLLLPEQDLILRNYPLNTYIGKGFNNVIGFLNDIQYKFPDAVSFVAGQPDEEFFDIENQISKFDLFVNHEVRLTGKAKKQVVNKIGQYNRTKGIVNDILAEYLRNDENINVRGEHILMTVGAQEAFAVIVSAICDREKDVILVEDPSYIGLSSFTKVFDYAVSGVPIDEEGIDLRILKNRIIELNRTGRKVKLLYVIPDYQNPSGACMPVGNRLRLLELARQYNFLIIEDSVYNSFTYAQKKNPTLKSLDRYNRVIYVGSFSKSLFPGLRVGLIAADQRIENEDGETTLLIDEMVKVKAQLTNNTSAITQAIVGGVLLELGCTLSEWNKPKFESYKRKRNLMIAGLHEYIKRFEKTWAKGITWNEPDGGFFIKMSLPFKVDSEDVFRCAAKHRVIFCPMRYFYLGDGGENEIRLTFSNLSLENIDLGLRQLAAYLKSRVGGQPDTAAALEKEEALAN
ncbi:MAG TPA: aminotransferase class I/II-fold pyridoxal phosphate-dependent enzyme [Puia sp.]|uniref:aminotransferase class I/II-fold pyridoxal phosphate-dependent enzyme n=1 Tax=Puia sp. TaxID=2045100 RepID=UPI002C16F83D|nr:aminotransferase class I/II-fold pyridoxal phosphate-dependent enzyme [Puia sp.]HVU95551.1 aminotransferase class I/II-fold pyridoxal phosphate-dependent enzyme [Puia sp.]